MTTLATNNAGISSSFSISFSLRPATHAYKGEMVEVFYLAESVKNLQWEFFPHWLGIKVKQSDPKTFELIRYVVDATDESIRYWNQTFDINL